MARLREVMQGGTEPKRIREITKPKTEVTVEALQKEVEEQRCKFAELENKVFRFNNGGFRSQEANTPNRFNQLQGLGNCWRCGSALHRICDCPVAATDESSCKGGSERRDKKVSTEISQAYQGDERGENLHHCKIPKIPN